LSCPECSASGVDHADVVRRCQESPYWSGRILCGFNKLDNDFHRAISEWYTRKLAEGKKRFIIMTPRGALKTSLFGISNIVWRLINNPERRVMYVMSSATEAQKTLAAVKRAHQSEAMQHFFPQRVHNQKKHKSSLEFMQIERAGNYREYSVEARGVDTCVIGGHFTDQIFDDLIDKTIKDSETEQSKVIDFFKDATNMFVVPDEDVRTVIGTLWEGAFYEWLLEESGLDKMYEKLIIGCRVDDRYREFLSSIGKRTTLKDGDPIWPEHFTEKTLESTMIEQGPLFFARQYLNKKTTDEDRRFRKEDFRHYRFNEDQTCVVPYDREEYKTSVSSLFRTLICDPATGKNKKTDDSAISVCGFDFASKKVFILEEWAGKVQPNALIDKIIEMAKSWKPQVVGIEEAAFQNVLGVFLRQKMAEERVFFNVKAVKPGGINKLTRIDALQPFVRNHQIFIQDTQYKLRDELCGIQVARGQIIGKSPNRADALAYHVQYWKHGRVDPIEDDDGPRTIVTKRQNASYGLECTT
jgi:predicted phage terminase large subunit-like protein